jgi:hypothetical protein
MVVSSARIDLRSRFATGIPGGVHIHVCLGGADCPNQLRELSGRDVTGPDSCAYFFLEDDLFRGTLPPSRRACAKPIAMACFRLFTFLPERPLFKVPLLRSCIAFSTFWDAFSPYLAISFSFGRCRCR